MTDTIDDDIRGLLAERLITAPPPPPLERVLQLRPTVPDRGSHWRWVAPSAVLALGVLFGVVLMPNRSGDRTPLLVGQQPPVVSSIPAAPETPSGVSRATLSSGGRLVEVGGSEGCSGGNTLCVSNAGPLLRQAPVLEVSRPAEVTLSFGAGRAPLEVTARVMASPDLRQTQTFAPAPADPTRFNLDLPKGSYYLLLTARWADRELTFFVRLQVLS